MIIRTMMMVGGASVMVAGGVVSAGEMAAGVQPAQPDDSSVNAKVHYTNWSGSDFDGASGGFNMHSFEALVPLGGGKSDRFGWLLEFDGGYTDFNVYDQPALRDRDLYRLGLDIGMIWLNDSAWSPSLKLEPVLSTDFKHLTSDDFNITATVGLNFAQRENLNWFFGVGYTSDLNDPTVYPTLGLDWQINDTYSLLVSGTKADLIYDSGQAWKARVFAHGYWHNWNLESSGNEQELQITSLQAGVGYERQLSENFWLDLAVGVNLGTEVELEDSAGVDWDEEADGSYFFRIGGRIEL